ncbi:MAG TPA: hypothetical protein VIG33_03160 [Pseudobdellovibrionaceae bacterium]
MNHSKSKEEIAKMVRAIFQTRYSLSQGPLHEELRAVKADFNARGILQSGAYAVKVGKMVGQALQNAVDDTIDEIESARREARRKDSSALWDTTKEILSEICDTEVTRANNQAVDIVGQTSRDGTFASIAAQHFSQFGSNLRWRIQTKIASLKAKSEFIALKTPEDRIAHGVPDVAIMMWFPTAERDGQEACEKAQNKFHTIEEVVLNATEGRATVRKFDDPNILPQDRISAAIEKWLEKAVLVICDLEGNRPNVFYEFGYARAVGTDVLATRPTGSETALHLGHWQMTEYSDLDELKTKLLPKLKNHLEKFDLTGAS